jgi:glycosyltransferase involved in cell wall biosynthesis
MLSVLRLLPRKNVLAVLDALPRALQWRWVVAGDGPQRPLVERRISELGLGTRVDLLGHVPYDELPDLYASADVYLQPSLSEPWGLAVNEAMASGLPVVVSTRCGCSEDLVRDGENGYVFDPADRESLHRVLDLMLASRHRWPEMGLASRDIISDWGPDRFARNFWKACEIAIANRRLASSGPLRRLTGASLSLFA